MLHYVLKGKYTTPQPVLATKFDEERYNYNAVTGGISWQS